MTWHLRNDDHLVNEKRIRRLMRADGASCRSTRRPNTSKAAKGHKIFTLICCAACAWMAQPMFGAPDITYLADAAGFLYLFAILCPTGFIAQHLIPEGYGLAHAQGAGVGVSFKHAGRPSSVV